MTRRSTTYHCEAPDCENRQESALPAWEAPIAGWVLVTTRAPSSDTEEHDFCSTDCAMRWAAQIEPPQEVS